MKIALFGATGMIGQRTLREALRRGHDVTAIVRNPAYLARQENARLHVAEGNILDAQSVAADVAGRDVVISAFGPRDDDPASVAAAAHALIAGLTRAGVGRLVIVGGAGSLEVAPGKLLIDSPDFPEAWKPIARAHAEALEVFRKKGGGIAWSYLSPPALIEPGERTETFRLGGDQLLTDADGQSRISAEDYAIAIMDEAENPQHVRQRFTIGY